AVLGVEAECRIAQGLGKAHYDLGWHVTGTAGVCGAAIAAGRALKLDPRQMACAIGIAATQSSGFREMFGSMCKSLHAGTAARNGLVAAMMAKAGFTSSEMVLEAPRGMIRVMSPQPAFERVLDGIGRRWETMANTYKPYACGLVIHPVIDACRTIRSEQGLAPQSIESVNLEVHPLVLELTGKTRPTNALEAKFSVFHAVAATLLDGASRPSHFTDAFARDSGVVALRDRVTARVRDELRKDEAHVVVTLKNGSRREAHTTHALGSLERPMTDDDLSGKFRELAAEHLSSPTTELVLEMCWKIAAAPAVSPLFDRLLVPQGAAAAESGH
ncbi:MAG: MmgE/PrpD family protein, partial [Burkholderiales bacterium]|nr:MmgE/PrpD family protein [Burkholderiales bacterium]